MSPTISDTSAGPPLLAEPRDSTAPAPRSQDVRTAALEGKSGSPWLLLFQSNFRLYFFGALVSNLGTWLQSTVQVIIAYQITHSVFVVGLITSAQFAGMIFSPWAAVLASRIGTKRFLMGTQSLSAAIALWMALLHHFRLLEIHTLIFGAFGLGLAYALALPVQTALLPTLVDPRDATDAVKMTSVSYNAGRALAPVLCVFVIALIGPGLIFMLNATSFIVFAACLAHVLGRVDNNGQQGLKHAHEKPAGRSEHPRVTDGFRTALRYRRIFLLLAIVAAVTFADDPIFVLSPALAHVKLHLPTLWIGYFIAALGWGSVAGSLWPTSRKSDARKSSRRAAIALIVLSISVIVFTMGLSREISLLAAMVAGAAGLYAGSSAQTALLLHQEKKAVVSVASVAALWAIAWAGTKPFASLLDGLLGAHVGLIWAAFALTTPALLIAIGEIIVPKWLKQEINAWAGRTIHMRLRSFAPRPHSQAMPATSVAHAVAPVADEIGSLSCDSCGQAGVLLPSRAAAS